MHARLAWGSALPYIESFAKSLLKVIAYEILSYAFKTHIFEIHPNCTANKMLIASLMPTWFPNHSKLFNKCVHSTKLTFMCHTIGNAFNTFITDWMRTTFFFLNRREDGSLTHSPMKLESITQGFLTTYLEDSYLLSPILTYPWCRL